MTKFKESSRSGEKSSIEVMFTIVFSLFAGFALGLLFAPQSGKKTIRDLTAKLRELEDRGKFALVEAKVMSEELLEKSKERVEKVSSKIKSKIEPDE
jgi:gas vesicle protein